MRAVDPFAYWEHHASAIDGLGGRDRSPDPRYLFHTDYHELRVGRARFVMTLHGVRASFGELSVRIHAYKPGGEGSVSLVSGARTLLHGDEAHITLPVPFASQAGVHYALYGYLSEDSDIIAETLRVAIDEPEDSGEALPDPPRSILAMDRSPAETRPANALLHDGRAELANPVSQSCTIDQVEALAPPADLSGRDRKGHGRAAIARWSEALCLHALHAYGATAAGLEGLVVGPLAAGGAQQLARFASVTRSDLGPPPSRTSDLFVDFLLMAAGFLPDADPPAGAEERWAILSGWLSRLKIGGLAIVSLRYRPDADLVSSSVVADPRVVTRNEIGRWVLRLISSGYSVAPMAFASRSELVLDDEGLAGFCLILQRF